MEGDNRIDSTAALELTEETSSKQTRVRGGYTCCVPGCYSNNKRDTTLSFHKFPQDEPEGPSRPYRILYEIPNPMKFQARFRIPTQNSRFQAKFRIPDIQLQLATEL